MTDSAWWNPESFSHKKVPEQWATTISNGQTNEEGGYLLLFKFGKEYDAFQLEVWKGADGHLVVEMWQGDGSISEMFVASYNAAAFIFVELPKMAAHRATAALADEAETVRIAMLAFIRHGHGKETISAHGDETKDDPSPVTVSLKRSAKQSE